APVHTSPTHLPATTRCSGLPMPRSRWSHPVGKSGSCRFPLVWVGPYTTFEDWPASWPIPRLDDDDGVRVEVFPRRDPDYSAWRPASDAPPKHSYGTRLPWYAILALVPPECLLHT